MNIRALVRRIPVLALAADTLHSLLHLNETKDYTALQRLQIEALEAATLADRQRQAELEQRVACLEQRITDLEQRLAAVDGTIAKEIYQLSLALQYRIDQCVFDTRQRLQTLRIEHQADTRTDESASGQSRLDGYRLAFETRFQGTRPTRMQQQAAYLAWLDDLPERPEIRAADLGCGRGEWVELLRRRGIQAQGVDHSGAMVAEAGRYNVAIEQGDLFDWLARRADGSLDLITAFHVVEYLDFERLMRLMELIRRKLRIGGLCLIETLDWQRARGETVPSDPDRRQSLSPELMRFIAEYHGFADIRIQRLEREPDGHEARNDGRYLIKGHRRERIDQFTPSIAAGDGVGNGVLFTRKLLHSLGAGSRIYADQIDESLRFEVLHAEAYHPEAEDVLLYHHAIGHRRHERMMIGPERKILVYHNITPPHFFSGHPELQRACEWGREQLAQSREAFVGAYADSDYNRDELIALGFEDPITLPLLVEIPDRPESDVAPARQDELGFVILFVGRLVENKMQHLLIEVVFELKRLGVEPLELVLVGGTSSPSYAGFVREHIRALGVEDEVRLLGRVSDAELVEQYRRAGLYLSLSEHEGFGMPLLEAIRYGVPVLAYDTGGIRTAIGEQGCLPFKTPPWVAGYIHDTLLASSDFRARLIEAQGRHRDTLSSGRLRARLGDALVRLGLQLRSLKT